MTTITASAHVSTFRRASSGGANPGQVRCAVQQQSMRGSRRSISLSLLFLHLFSRSEDAMAAATLDKYFKRKKLDPLESYIPAVILTELQIKELGEYLEVDQPKFVDCRSLLRSGPASSLRINIRAVAEYASDAGNGESAFNKVDQCLRALEELDSLLLRASRNNSQASVEPMKLEVATVLDALNSLLKTIPVEMLDKGKAMAKAYLAPGEDLAPGDLDPQLKQLESIL